MMQSTNCRDNHNFFNWNVHVMKLKKLEVKDQIRDQVKDQITKSVILSISYFNEVKHNVEAYTEHYVVI